jgi:hexosaminidase
MIKSAVELNEAVRDMGASMVIENMLGFELKADANRERALCRTVEETLEIMNRLPANIYSAVDLNHIAEPEKLIRALGSRVKSLHVADGEGKYERHYFPCSGKGSNNWTEILSALHETAYNGPFMYESSPEDIKDYKECYETLYDKFISEKTKGN